MKRRRSVESSSSRARKTRRVEKKTYKYYTRRAQRSLLESPKRLQRVLQTGRTRLVKEEGKKQLIRVKRKTQRQPVSKPQRPKTLDIEELGELLTTMKVQPRTIQRARRIINRSLENTLRRRINLLEDIIYERQDEYPTEELLEHISDAKSFLRRHNYQGTKDAIATVELRMKQLSKNQSPQKYVKRAKSLKSKLSELEDILTDYENEPETDNLLEQIEEGRGLLEEGRLDETEILISNITKAISDLEKNIEFRSMYLE